MHRTRTEAEELARQRHGELPQAIFPFVVSHYMRIHDWACANCAKIGTVIKINDGIRTADCMCRIIRDRKLAAAKLKEASNIPIRYQSADLKKWMNVGRTVVEIDINKSSFSAVTSYAANISKMLKKGYGLYLTGPNGVGKTFLACAIGNRAIDMLHSVKYYTMSVIIQTEIRGWRDQEAASLMAGIKKSALLIIDDIDKIYKTTTGIETALFDNLLRERLQSNRPCIFTSNRTVSDAKASYTEHIASMLVEHCAELVFVGQDHRRNMSETIKKEIINGGG